MDHIINFKKIAIFAAIAVVIAATTNGCSVIKEVPVVHTEYVHTIDSVYVKDTTIQYRIEKEYVKEYAKDTLRLETNYSEFTAFQDSTTGMLAGTAKNKEKLIDIPISVKEKVVVRDSVVYKEVPVKVEVPVKYTPKIWKILGWIGILSLVAGVLLILRKFGVI